MAKRPGVALLNVLFFTFVTSAFLVVGVQIVTNALKAGRNAKGDAQVYNVARAGIAHAVSWLQQQDEQPVLVFDPKAHIDAPEEDPETPPGEEQLGLVHEFEIDPTRHLWGRYEVARSAAAPNPAPARDALQAGPASVLHEGQVSWTAEDVSLQRGSRIAGTVWRVRSRGYVFERLRPNDAFDPAKLKAHQVMTLETEVRRGAFRFRDAALYGFIGQEDPARVNGAHVDLHAHGDRANTRLEVADGAGYNYLLHTDRLLTNRAEWSGGTSLTGQAVAGASDPAGANFVQADLSAQLKDVFGVPDMLKLKELATSYYEDPFDLPQPMSAMGFYYLRPDGGKVVFDGAPQLGGGGVLVIEGDCHIKGDAAPQTFDGLLFVTGHLEIEKAVTITGAIMAAKTVEIHGSAGKPAVVRYAKAVLDRVNAQLGSYREARSSLRIIEGTQPGPVASP